MTAKRVFFSYLLLASLCNNYSLEAQNQGKTFRRNPYYNRRKNSKNQLENSPQVSEHEIKIRENNGEEVEIPVDEGLEAVEKKVIIPQEILRPVTATDDPSDLIDINFNGADLNNVLEWLSRTFQVQFITDDIIAPPPAGGKQVVGNKITFKTQKPLTKRQVWDLSITFLDLFGLSIAPGTVPNFYKVLPTDPGAPRSIARQTLPAYINISWQELPNNDTRIRYTYFVRNSSLATIQGIVDAFRSVTGILKPLQDLNAFILTDKASNVRSIMEIVEELDATTQPEAMSVLKLKHADAEDVKTLYENLTKTEDPRGLAARLLGAKKLPTAVYFPENLRVFAERRTNTLIILGPEEGIKKIEEFIVNHIDTELKIPYSPLYIYELQYTKAEDIAQILTQVTKFAPETPAAQSGGVRDGDKYLRPMTFQAESSGNRLLINAEKEDYLKVVEIIKQLDVKQPQVAIEVLIVNVISAENKELGVQIRNPSIDALSNRIEFQTSGLAGSLGTPVAGHVVLDPTNGSLLGNLVNLAEGQTPGSLLISIANSANGVWALFKILDSAAHTNIIANPFLVAINNYQSQVAIGEQRYVKSGLVQGGGPQVPQFDYVTANLTVQIKPLINIEGNINLTIDMSIDSFTVADDPNDATRETKTIHTIANVGNREVLALGGLLKFNEEDATTKVPVLGDIPILGWLFKNKTKTKTKDNLLVFISPRIVEPKLEGGLNAYSLDKANHAKNIMCEMRQCPERRDVIHRWFFKDRPCENVEYIDSFIAQDNPPSTKFYAPYPYYCPGEKVIQPTPCERLEYVNNEELNKVAKKILVQAKPDNKKTKSITAFLPEESPTNEANA